MGEINLPILPWECSSPLDTCPGYSTAEKIVLMYFTGAGYLSSSILKSCPQEKSIDQLGGPIPP